MYMFKKWYNHAEYSIYSKNYENEGTSSSVSDLDSYVIIPNILDSIFHILLGLICQWEIQTYFRRTFLP